MKRFVGISLPGLFLCGLIGVLLGSGGYTAYYAEGASYLSDDPKACVNCHVMRDHYAGWQKASHQSFATCNDCHVPQDLVSKYLAKGRNGFWHSKGFTFQDFPEPIRIHAQNSRILQENCVRCHQDLISQTTLHAGSDAESRNCVRCHDAAGHGPTR
jgi:cytochrome c nitrite reductase small subunit